MWGWRDYPVYEASRNKQHPHNTDFATELPFIEHVRELRRRIIYSLAAIVLLFAPIYYFANELYLIIAALPRETSMILAAL